MKRLAIKRGNYMTTNLEKTNTGREISTSVRIYAEEFYGANAVGINPRWRESSDALPTTLVRVSGRVPYYPWCASPDAFPTISCARSPDAFPTSPGTRLRTPSIDTCIGFRPITAAIHGAACPSTDTTHCTRQVRSAEPAAPLRQWAFHCYQRCAHVLFRVCL